MKMYKNAGELLADYNTPVSEGGLLHEPVVWLRWGKVTRTIWEYRLHTDALKADPSFPKIRVAAKGDAASPPNCDHLNGGFPLSHINGKFWGQTGFWTRTQKCLVDVVESTKSGIWHFEKVLAKDLTVAQATEKYPHAGLDGLR